MPAESLNHYTIQARDLEKTKEFYEQNPTKFTHR